MDEPLKLIRAAQWCTAKNVEQLALNKCFKKDLIKWSIAHEFFSLLSRLLALTSATQWNETISKIDFIIVKVWIRLQKLFEKKMNMMSLFFHFNYAKSPPNDDATIILNYTKCTGRKNEPKIDLRLVDLFKS